ncbi:hypothetical protein [Escherichia phage vB_EcoM-LTH01]
MSQKRKSLSEKWLSNGMSNQWIDSGLATCLKKPNKTLIEEEPKDEVFESPNGSVWIVAVDYSGRVTVLKAPNIHPALLDEGPEAEYIGLPPDSDSGPGVYRWTCSYHESKDRESNLVDGFEFHVEKEEVLFSV